jgi:UDPglucose 6-dehydrogenase
MYKGTILIVGYGVVGNNMRKLLEPHVEKIFIHDPAKGYTHTDPVDIAFVCVPTDRLEDGSADTSIVEKVCEEIKANVIVIKSTVPPGTIDRIFDTREKEDGAPYLVFSPEYFGGTQHANAVNNDFVILGETVARTRKGLNGTEIVAELYKHVFDGRGRIIKTDWKTAELVKYMENAFFAAKVAFVNEFSLYAEHIGVDRDELRELWLLDDRIGRSHTFSYRDAPFYDSHCLNKDIPAIIAQAKKDGGGLPLLTEIDRLNGIMRGIAGFHAAMANKKETEPPQLEKDAAAFVAHVNAYGARWRAKIADKDTNFVEVLIFAELDSGKKDGNVILYLGKGANVENIPSILRNPVIATLKALGYNRTYV